MSEQDPAAAREATSLLVENHRAFLRFLQRRVRSHDLAEDILQSAFVKSLNAAAAVPEEALVPWFYRVLRNAVIDHLRRDRAASEHLQAFAREMKTAVPPPQDLHEEICRCVSRLARTLKPEYAQALQAIEIEGASVKAFAEQHGLSPTNAGVRVFRARQALKRRVTESCGTCAEHGCTPCTCHSAG